MYNLYVNVFPNCNTISAKFISFFLLDNCVEGKCHTNATCKLTKYSYKCPCKKGFYGNGTHCSFISLYGYCYFKFSLKKLCIIFHRVQGTIFT